jgi:hypothetical protein
MSLLAIDWGGRIQFANRAVEPLFGIEALFPERCRPL